MLVFQSSSNFKFEVFLCVLNLYLLSVLSLFSLSSVIFQCIVCLLPAGTRRFLPGQRFTEGYCLQLDKEKWFGFLQRIHDKYYIDNAGGTGEWTLTSEAQWDEEILIEMVKD